MSRRCAPVLVATVAAFALVFAQAALAHGSEPQLEIGSDRVSPGAPLTVRGIAFAYEEAVMLSLVGGNRTTRLGTVTTDAEGEFTHTLVVPANLAEGSYSIRAADGHHTVDGPLFVVSGAPVSTGEDGDGRREEEDSLLAPMPSVAGTTIGAGTTTVVGGPGDSSRSSKPILAVVVAVAILAGALGVRAVRGRQ